MFLHALALYPFSSGFGLESTKAYILSVEHGSLVPEQAEKRLLENYFVYCKMSM